MGFSSGVKYERLREAVDGGGLATLGNVGMRRNGKYTQLTLKWRDSSGGYHLLSKSVKRQLSDIGKREANTIKAEWRAQVVADMEAIAATSTDTSRTVGDVVEDYIASRVKVDADGNPTDLRKSTVTNYRYSAMRLNTSPELRDMPIHDVRGEDVQKWIDAMESKYSKSSIQSALTLLRSTFKFAKVADPSRDCSIGVNVRRTRKGRVYSSRPNHLTRRGVAHLNAILATARDSNVRRVGVLGIHLGLRVAEMAALKWADIDFDERVVRVRAAISRHTEFSGDGTNVYVETVGLPKTSAGVRDLPMDETLYTEMMAWREKDAEATYVIGGGQTFVSPNHLSHTWTVFARANHIEGTQNVCTVHDLRHTFATLSIGEGVPVSVVAKNMGHEHVSVTLDRYVGADEEMQKEAANMMASVFSAILADEEDAED